MSERLRRLAVVGLVPITLDFLLLMLFRQEWGWMLVVADGAAVALASVVSYELHRTVTFRSDPYVRWVQVPLAYVGVAGLATIVDVVVLRAVYAGTGFTSATGLFEAKLVSFSCATIVRLVGYRWLLLVNMTRARQNRTGRPPAPGSLRFSVVVPAYQEADRIRSTVHAIRAALADVRDDGGLEVVVVDDGSDDGTFDAALDAGADQVVAQPENRGKGAAVRAGTLASRGRTVAFTDADLSYAPEQLRRVLDAVEDGWDVAIGNRSHPDAHAVVATSPIRRIGSRLINVLGYAVLLGSFRDTQCGLKGFRSDVGRFVFDRARVDGFAFDIELLHLVERYDFSLVEVPVEVMNTERSTVSVGRDGLRLIRDLFRIRHWSATGVYEASGEEHALMPDPSAPGRR